MRDFKATQMNMQSYLICKFMLYAFKVGYITIEAKKNICNMLGEGAVNQNTVNRWFERFHSGYKILLDSNKVK